MKGNFDKSQPIFRQIIDQILMAIASGELSPGEKVASVREMALEYKVNPNTMQKSLAKLEEMGFMYTERTSGRYVTNDTAIIESLKSRLPTRLTEEYIKEMMECGIPAKDILNYVDVALPDYIGGQNG